MKLKELLRVTTRHELYIYRERHIDEKECPLIWSPKDSRELLKKFYDHEILFIAAYDFNQLNVYIYSEEV